MDEAPRQGFVELGAPWPGLNTGQGTEQIKIQIDSEKHRCVPALEQKTARHMTA